MESIIGYLFTMALSMFMAAGFWTFAQKGVDAVQDTIMAQQAQTVNDAAVRYVQDNAGTFLATATAATPVTVNIPALACAGYLPASYEAGSGCPAPAGSLGIKNALQQNWLLQVGQPTAGKLQAVVISQNGSAYPMSSVSRMVAVASQIGAAGGFVPYLHQGGDSTMNPANAQGVYNGWSMAPMTTNGFTNPGPGHFVSLLSFRNGQTSSTFLYRSAVAGQSQLNTMNTPLIMNTPQSVGTTCTVSGAIANDANGGFLMCQTSILGTTWENWMAEPVASTANLPACAAGSTNMQVALVSTPNAGGSGPSLYACTAATGWVPIGVDANGNLSVPNTLTAGTIRANSFSLTSTQTIASACASVGQVGVDATGVLLTCQSGGVGLTWQQTGQIAASGSGCAYPGMIARDTSNNLYICN